MEVRRNGKAGQSLNSDINVTPLVDVMLVVLIIFMVVTPMLQKGMSVKLPEARNLEAVPESKDQVIMVVLQQNGQMFIGSDPIDRVDLLPALRSRFRANPGLELQIKADANVPYGDVKQIVKAGREAGFSGAAMIAREIKPSSPSPAGGAAPGAGSPAGAGSGEKQGG